MCLCTYVCVYCLLYCVYTIVHRYAWQKYISVTCSVCTYSCVYLCMVYVACHTCRKKKLQSEENGYSGMDGKRSMSQDTSNSFDLGSKSELVSYRVEHSPPTADVVVCSGGPPIPGREPRGELVVSLSPSPALTANGRSVGQ